MPQYPAYGSIVAAGPNACVLHCRADTAPVRAGELVLIDAGCELDGYASDITRTFLADWRFAGQQRALYELVLASKRAAIAATRAGMVLTIEPGIHVRPAPGVPEQFHHIGIRIEDDAIVTDAGCGLMTRGVPVEPDEIEALMRV